MDSAHLTVPPLGRQRAFPEFMDDNQYQPDRGPQGSIPSGVLTQKSLWHARRIVPVSLDARETAILIEAGLPDEMSLASIARDPPGPDVVVARFAVASPWHTMARKMPYVSTADTERPLSGLLQEVRTYSGKSG